MLIIVIFFFIILSFYSLLFFSVLLFYLWIFPRGGSIEEHLIFPLISEMEITWVQWMPLKWLWYKDICVWRSSHWLISVPDYNYIMKKKGQYMKRLFKSISQGIDRKTFPSHWTPPWVQLNPSLRNGRNMARVNLPRAGCPHKLFVQEGD